MPTYSYECSKCGKVFDVFHGMNDAPKIKCEACGAKAKKLLGTGAGFIFKGSGFYETDFKEKKGKPDKAPSESGGGEGKAESKAESKSEAKPESKLKPEPKKESKPKPEKK